MTAPSHPQLPRPGAVIGSPRGVRYALGAVLGEGAFGAVFESMGPFDQPVAVKALVPSQKPWHEARAEWQREVARLVALRHPNIVYVFDSFEQGGLFFQVLERCDHSLAAMLGRPLADGLVVEFARQILLALAYLHDAGVVHNDLHAGNVLVVQGEPLRLKVGDLGIAQELYGRHGVRPPLVHHLFMAPEVLRGGFTTRQSDLYQLGLLLFALHTGSYPLELTAPREQVAAAIEAGVPRSRAEALGTPLAAIIAKLLRRHEAYRYATPAEVWDDLRRLRPGP